MDEKKKDYTVGYAKPPAHTRFKKGDKPPPGAGRRRGSKNRITKIKQSLEETSTVRMGDKVVKMDALEIALARNREATSKGNPRAIDRTIKLQQEVEAEEAARAAMRQSIEPDPIDITEEDEAILLDFLRHRQQVRDAF